MGTALGGVRAPLQPRGEVAVVWDIPYLQRLLVSHFHTGAKHPNFFALSNQRKPRFGALLSRQMSKFSSALRARVVERHYLWSYGVKGVKNGYLDTFGAKRRRKNFDNFGPKNPRGFGPDPSGGEVWDTPPYYPPPLGLPIEA